ncbi:GNAT family N-acetyltransferase [Longispora fulva]|uniref:GNAT superfamily N-acetyltransferase n=1 Tax=Longispora fulva TaxID=619741 RepID=A0A8J7KFN2_9ACTN|nr:GNAT family N-acetyltransferase [Longispora fulva]MBG6136410.1 GNAT superfamily N-acetyltransferase [Longispora fulva]
MDFEAWRQVRIAVLPYERCPSVEELRAVMVPERLMLLAEVDGELAGSGLADKSHLAGVAGVAPRVLPAFRRRGVGGAVLRELAEHCLTIGVPHVGASADDPGSVAFAEAFGFVEVDREVEQVRKIGVEPEPELPVGLTVVSLAERPELWAAAFDTLGRQAVSDFAVDRPIEVTAEEWERDWKGEPAGTFMALAGDEIVGTAGLTLDPDQPNRAEHALTAVGRHWRGRGVASALKRLTLHWASQNGLTEVYTWTQRGNENMRQLNEHLGYEYRTVSVRVRRELPL